jgi:hypothetical protein
MYVVYYRTYALLLLPLLLVAADWYVRSVCFVYRFKLTVNDDVSFPDVFVSVTNTKGLKYSHTGNNYNEALLYVTEILSDRSEGFAACSCGRSHDTGARAINELLFHPADEKSITVICATSP